MNLVPETLAILHKRPFMTARHLRDVIRFSLNGFFIRIFPMRNVSIGKYPHLYSLASLQAERLGASITTGEFLSVAENAKIYAWANGAVKIGNACRISGNTTIHCRERIAIGNYVLISWNVLVADFDAHSLYMDDRIAEIEHMKSIYWARGAKRIAFGQGYFSSGLTTKPIIIEDGVWIGANAIILKGAHIGRGAVIGAGAVVTGDIPPLCVAAGNPARVVKQLTTEKENCKNE